MSGYEVRLRREGFARWSWRTRVEGDDRPTFVVTMGEGEAWSRDAALRAARRAVRRHLAALERRRREDAEGTWQPLRVGTANRGPR